MALDWRLRGLLWLSKQLESKTFDADVVSVRRDFESTMRTLRWVATGPGPRMLSETDVSLPVPDGAISVRVFRPIDGRLPVVLFCHGGGWVVGSLDSYAPWCRSLAAAANALVVAVDYRRAPEHRFPTALEDCYAALEWVAESDVLHGGDSSRLAVVGDSAGGHLAAAVSLVARDRRGPRVACQVLLNPIIEPTFERPSTLAYATGFGLTRQRMEWYWNHYAPPGIDRSSVWLSVLSAPLKGAPPAVVVTPECDVLHDDGVAYVAALRSAGVEVEHLEVPGVIHGFALMQRLLPQARDTLSLIAQRLRQRTV